MKLMSALALSASLLSAASAFACGEAEQELVIRTRGLFGAGEVTRTDVASAELKLLDARLECQELTKEQYCAEAPLSADVLYTGTRLESRVGQRTEEQVYDARKKREDVNNYCYN